MRFVGLLDHHIGEIIEFYATREAAETVLEAILRDEPTWADKLELVSVDFTGASVIVEPARGS